MILEEETIEIIKEALKICKQFGMTVMKIDDAGIRATDDKGTVALLSKHDFNIGGIIGINRLELLFNRLGILKDGTVEAHFENGNSKSISFTNKKTVIEYRTANAAFIKVPSMPKNGDLYQLSITADMIDTITKGKSAMKSDIITLLCDDNRLSYKIADETSDTLLYDGGYVVNMSDDDTPANFVNVYPSKAFLYAINNCDEVVGIDIRNILRFKINNFNIHLLPKV